MLRHRVFTGVAVCSAVFGILFFLPAWTHLGLLLAVFALLQLEWDGFARAAGLRYALGATSVLGAALLFAAAAESPAAVSRFPCLARLAGCAPVSSAVAAFAPAALLALGVLRRRTDRALESFAVSLAGFWYVAAMLSFVVRLAFLHPAYPGGRTNYTGRILLLLFILLVKTTDIGAYAVGCRWGRHKLIPAVSPAKTVEGMLGGYAGSLLSGVAFWAVLRWGFGDGRLGQLAFPFVHAVALPLLLATTGMAGDLAESLLKRSVGVKDSSSRFPGMGGAMDIMDSLMFSAPFMFAYAACFLK